MSTQDWVSMGLAHLQPHQPAFAIPPSTAKKKGKTYKHPALYTHAYTTASTMCETKEEREILKQHTIRAYETAQVLRVNPYSDMGRSTKPTNSELAPR